MCLLSSDQLFSSVVDDLSISSSFLSFLDLVFALDLGFLVAEFLEYSEVASSTFDCSGPRMVTHSSCCAVWLCTGGEIDTRLVSSSSRCVLYVWLFQWCA